MGGDQCQNYMFGISVHACAVQKRTYNFHNRGYDFVIGGTLFVLGAMLFVIGG